MPLISTFPGPRTALLWQFAMRIRPITLAYLVAGIALACLDGIEVLEEESFYFFFTMALVTWQDTRINPYSDTFTLRLPVSTPTLCAIGILSANGVFLTLLIAYTTTLNLLGHSDIATSLKFMLFFIPVGHFGVCIGAIRGPASYRIPRVIVCGAPMMLGIFLLAFLNETVEESIGTVATLTAVISHICYYQVLTWLIGERRQGIHMETHDEDTANDNTGWTPAPSETHPLQFTADSTTPFSSRFSAQTWYTGRLLFRTASEKLGEILVCLILLVLFLWGPGEENSLLFPENLIVLSMFLLLTRFCLWWQDAIPQLPHSNWSETWIVSGLGLAAIGVCSVVIWVLHTLLTPWDNPLGILELLNGIWVAWSGLAMAPAVLLSHIIAGGLKFSGYQLYPLNGADLCILWLGAMVIYQWRRIQPNRGANSRRPLTIITVLLLGLSALSRFESGSYGLWAAREALGLAVLLGLLKLHVRAGTVPRRDAVLLGVVSIGLTLLMAVVVSQTGFPYISVPDATAALLTFGYVPSVVLPLIVLPIFLTWQKENEPHYRRSRKETL